MGDKKPARPRGKRLLRTAYLLVFVLVSVIAVAGFFAYHRAPSHWTQQQQRIEGLSVQQREQISELLFNRATTQWSKAPPEATTVDDLIGHRSSLEIKYEELNVWLAEQGIALLSDVGVASPRSVRGVMIDSPGDGLLRISCDIKTNTIEQVIGLTFDIDVQDDGAVVSKLTSASVGLLPLPTEQAIGMIAKRENEAGLLHALMSGTPTGPIDIPIDASKDGLRDGRLVGFDVYDDRLVITRETVLRDRSKQEPDTSN